MTTESPTNWIADEKGETRPAPAPPSVPAADGPRASSEEILDALSQVFDPEIGIDIVNLGLVYEAVLDEKGVLTIDMTLTSPYCPMGGIIQSQAHAVVAGLPGVQDVAINLVWQPPWDPRTMASEEAQLELGIY